MSHPYTEVLKKIEDPTIPERAAALLRSPNPGAQEAAVEILIDRPSPAALDRLWELRCSLEENEERFFFRHQVQEALASCVKLMPEWLHRAIQRSDPNTEPFSALVYLLVQLEDTAEGERIWREVRDTALAKTPAKDRRALFYASESFRDGDTLERLAGSIHEDDDLIAPAALRALGLLKPEEALAALERSPLDSSLLWARSWWLPQLLAHDYDRTSEILRRRIQEDENPWLVAAVYDHSENSITPEILDLLLEATGQKLERALAQPPSENQDPLARPFSFLSEVSRLDLLERFETRRGTPFEKALTAYLIRQGPNDEGWHRWGVWDGISVLQKLGGEGFTLLANYYLRSAKTRLGIRDGLLLGVQRPNGETVQLVIELAHDADRGGQTEDGFPLVQYEVVKALAALGQWREMVRGCLRLGLKTPRSLPEYLEGHVFTDEELTDALSELHSGAPSPGALLTIGLSGRPNLSPEIRAIYRASESDSETALACLLALQHLRDLESEDIFLENLDSPKNGWVAVRALLGAVRTPRGDEAVLERLRHLGRVKVKGSEQQILVMNLLIREDTRERAAQILWDHLSPREILFYTGDTIEHLAVLDRPEVKEFLRNAAFSDHQGAWHRADRHAAIEGLRRFEPETAFEAAKALFRSDDGDRLLCPETLLKIDAEAALLLFRETLVTTKDFLLVAAIGEALDRHGPTEPLRAWLTDSDPRARQGACFVMESLGGSAELEAMALSLLQDSSWDVRAAARVALEDLQLSRETARLAREVKREGALSRRWVLVDAALTIGYPGVVAGYGAHSWFGPMIEGQPYTLRTHALSKLEEKRKKLRDTLAKRERS
ncbi:MAG TPA: hypothetical protein VGP73_28615 [Thermoanaerobaculia bacterium]